MRQTKVNSAQWILLFCWQNVPGSISYELEADTKHMKSAKTADLVANRQKTEVPMAKLNAENQVLTLENTVMEGTVSDVKALFAQYRSFEFTARALGIAMRFRGLDMTQALVESGASLEYVMVRRLFERYDCGLDETKERGKDYACYLFPAIPIAPKYSGYSISDEARVAVMEYLIERNIPGLHSFLYYAVLANDTAVTECLRKHNIGRFPAPYADLVQGLVPPSELERLALWTVVEELRMLLGLYAADDLTLINVLEQLAKCVPGEISLFRYSLLDVHRVCSPKLFVPICRLTSEVRKLERWEVFRELINQGNASGIDYILKNKWVKNVGDIEFLLQLAHEKKNSSPEIATILLETLENKRGGKASEPESLGLDEAKPLTLSEVRQEWPSGSWKTATTRSLLTKAANRKSSSLKRSARAL